MNGSPKPSTAICILGVHRSGTSTLTRAINALGAYLGEEKDLMRGDSANPEGYWERLDICNLQERLLTRLKRTWDTAAPLPDQWHLSEAVRPFREELKQLVAAHFAPHFLWAWKDPRSCLFLPLWKDVLDELEIQLLCVFVVRSPLDVARSLKKRDYIPLQKAFGIWFNYSVAALQGTAGAPLALVSYDRFLESWETELRKCAAVLGIQWPGDEQRLKETMQSFIRPNLRHSRSTPRELETAPSPVRELYGLMVDAAGAATVPDGHLARTVGRLAEEFRAYASFFQTDIEDLIHARIARGAGMDMNFVIAVANDLESITRCLDSLGRSGVPDSDIVVVDNASIDGTREFLAARPFLRVISNTTDRGRGAAWNQGVEATHATWTVVLDPNVIVVPGFREGLASFVQQRHRDIVSPALSEGELDCDFPAFAEAFVKRMGSARRRGVAWGCSFMVHRRVFHTVGLFDARADLVGNEDADFFRRAHEAGFKLAVTGKACVHHFESIARLGAATGLKLAADRTAGGTDYYRKKHRLTWRRRVTERVYGGIRGAVWRWVERGRFGMTLRMRRHQRKWEYR